VQWCYNPLVRGTVALLFTLLAFAAGLSAQQRKLKKPKDEKEPATQTLEIPKEPPQVISAETGKLVFHASPLSAKGLLSQQIRDALKSLERANGGATIVKLRAFVAGAGDLRRVATIVSEEFSSRKLPIPVVSTIQVGALPLEGAQVLIESVSADKKTVNPSGLAFFSAQSATQLRTAAQGIEVLRVTCFLSSLDQEQTTRAEVAAAFPGAAMNFVQLTRMAVPPLAACEAVGRLEKPPTQAIELMDGVALTSRPKLVFTALQIAFRDQDADIRLAFERLGKALESQGASFHDVIFSSTYSLNRSVADKAAAVRLDFMAAGRAPGTAQVFEGLPSLDATMAVEVIAAK
jgi:enamine deaminase RidA (YjgF/YER057c/UK114 family)